MGMQENKALGRRYMEELWSQGNLAIADEIISADCVVHDPSTPVQRRGPAGEKEAVRLYRDAYPDLRFEIADMIAEGDMVAIRFRAGGTHKGSLMGIAPTGKQTAVTGMSMARIVSGKIAEGWVNYDALGLMQQLGVVPQMAPSGAQ